MSKYPEDQIKDIVDKYVASERAKRAVEEHGVASDSIIDYSDFLQRAGNRDSMSSGEFFKNWSEMWQKLLAVTIIQTLEEYEENPMLQAFTNVTLKDVSNTAACLYIDLELPEEVIANG